MSLQFLGGNKNEKHAHVPNDASDADDATNANDATNADDGSNANDASDANEYVPYEL
jgi:hypothetical protein